MAGALSRPPYRVFPPEWDHFSTAKYLRRQARAGFLRGRGFDKADRHYVTACTCGVNLPPAPNSVSLTLTRDYMADDAMRASVPITSAEWPDGWHLSVCCVTDRGYRGYQPDEGEHWLELIFGPYRERVTETWAAKSVTGSRKGVQHFLLPCDWQDKQADPACDLAGLI